MEDHTPRPIDAFALNLRTVAQSVILVVSALLPLIFLPSNLIISDYTKVMCIAVALFFAIVLYSLSVLREGIFSFRLSSPLLALWTVFGVSLVSSLLSGDFRDSFVGDFFSIHATAFVGLMALIATTAMVLSIDKMRVMYFYTGLIGTTLILLLFHAVRLIFGADVLTFGTFIDSSATPIGTWNDLGLFLGMLIVLSLVALEQLPLTRIGKIMYSVVVVVSTLLLSVINFFTVWVMLGLISLALVMYTLTKGRFTDATSSLIPAPVQKGVSIWLALFVCLFSLLFVIGGPLLGQKITELSGVTYIEVRPSFEATADITRQVYAESPLLGIGTNKFVDAWRLYKDNGVNNSVFWNTDFNAGNGYIPTFFVTTGVLGGIAWIIFVGLYAIVGVRRLLGATNGDQTWYVIGVASFVSSMYVWVVSFFYVPGATVLVLVALITGIALASFEQLSTRTQFHFMLPMNRRTGFVIVSGVMVSIITSVGILYVVGRHYSSVYAFYESVYAMNNGVSIDVLEEQVTNAFALSSSDVFARRIAEYELARINQLIALQNPTEEDQKAFILASSDGISAIRRAIAIDGSEPANWMVLGRLYAALASVNVPDADTAAIDAFVNARTHDPKNPLPYLEQAVVEARTRDYDSATALIADAVRLKSNYVDAFYLQSQIDIAKGDVAAAVQSTRASITLEPKNDARHYQLGVLESAAGNVAGAMSAFETAIRINSEFANARYLLAQLLIVENRLDEARAQLDAVLKLNPGNEDVLNLIRGIEAGTIPESVQNQNNIGEPAPQVDENGVVRTQQDSDTTLVSPVNTPPASSDTE